MAAFHYNYAIVSRIPNSFKDKAITAGNEQIDVDKAREEYKELLSVLQKCDINLIELQEDEKYPDCCFVEDTAVVIGGTVLITRPGHPSRQGEVSVTNCCLLCGVTFCRICGWLFPFLCL